jgi:hypothetical protein
MSKLILPGQGGGIIQPGRARKLILPQQKKILDGTGKAVLGEHCKAFRCPRRANEDFCAFHFARIPSELRREYENAKDESKRLKRRTSRFVTAFQNSFRVLAAQDVEAAKAKTKRTDIVEEN